MEKIYDCIVVGAGPAGASAAYFLAKSGYSVLILEKKMLPRYKPCGGGIPTVVSTFFDFPLFEEKDTAFLKELIYSFRGTKQSKIALDKHIMFGISRSAFDYKITRKACDQKAHLIQKELVNKIKEGKEKVTVYTKEGNAYCSKFLLSCDGADSAISMFLGLRKNTKPNAVSMVAEIDSSDYHRSIRGEACLQDADMNSDRKLTGYLDMTWIKNGYAGLIPKKHGCSIGVYTLRQADIRELKQKLDEFGQYLGLNISNLPHHTRFMHVWDKNFKLNTSRCLLLGDSARLIDPLSGEGIKYAIKSAIIAAKTIKAAFENNESLDEYTKQIQSQISRELSLAKKMAFWSYHFPKAAYDGLIRVSEDTAKILNGEISYAEFIKRLKRKILKTFLKKIGITGR